MIAKRPPRLSAPLFPARLSWVPLLVLAGLASSCAGSGEFEAVSAGFVVESLENRLLAAESVDFDFHITTEGAVEADLRGTCSIGPHDAVLRAHGEFAHMPFEVSMASTRDKVLGHTAGRPIDVPRGDALRDSLLLGMTRMGLLHNLAKLFSGAGPDHRESGVGDWARVVDIYAQRDGALSMNIMVDDQESGEAVLTLDADGLPQLRVQTVHFSQGTMHVTEEYSRMHVAEPASDR